MDPESGGTGCVGGQAVEMSGTGQDGGCMLIVDRGAVANGDDGVPHGESWLFPPDSTITDLLVALATGYLPAMGMWLVHVEVDAQRRDLLGIVNYDLGTARSPCGPLMTPIMSENMALTALSEWYQADHLVVFGSYRSGLNSQLATLEQIRASRGHTGGTPAVIQTGLR